MAKSILDILVTKNLLTLEEAARVRKDAKEREKPIEEVLYERGITETDVTEAKSVVTGLPIKYLEGKTIPYEMLTDIPEESARYYQMVPLGRNEGYLDVGMLYPENVAAHEALKFISARVNLPVRIFLITKTDFNNIVKEYKGLSGEVTKALGEFKKEYETLTEEVKIRRFEPARIVEEAPVSKMLAVILRHAVEGRASDIHIEPSRNNVRVRFRVDGVLHTGLTLPLDVQSALVTRIKVISNLKIDETRVPQDGRFHAEIVNRAIDFRVSTFPTSLGEKIAIRILDPETGVRSLSELGIEGRNLELIEQGIKRPFGMILITGPTGSGKSTTLYALLRILNQEGVNIVSLEDPVEYYIDGVNQSQIRPEINYDFAAGIRSVVRQDPDIIMVGEIRDKETAALAVHAALTGHLVLSTLHTNNAVGVIPRLIDMGIDPYLIPPTLTLAVGQRLVRTLCPDSKKKIPLVGALKETIMAELEKMPEEVRASLDTVKPTSIWEPEISAICPKGTRGRIGVFEALSMTPELERIILTDPSESKIEAEAVRQGMITMKQDGILKVLRGIVGAEALLEIVI